VSELNERVCGYYAIYDIAVGESLLKSEGRHGQKRQ
jgi:hypothetical protein